MYHPNETNYSRKKMRAASPLEIQESNQTVVYEGLETYRTISPGSSQSGSRSQSPASNSSQNEQSITEGEALSYFKTTSHYSPYKVVVREWTSYGKRFRESSFNFLNQEMALLFACKQASQLLESLDNRSSDISKSQDLSTRQQRIKRLVTDSSSLLEMQPETLQQYLLEYESIVRDDKVGTEYELTPLNIPIVSASTLLKYVAS
jgi:hypothetical protein